MATERINETTQFRMRFIDSVVDGKEKLMTRTFSGVKLAATDDAIFDTAVLISGAQMKTLKHIVRVGNAEIVSA